MVPPFDKPLGNFFIGIGEDLLFMNQDYLKCFPPEWINKNESSEQTDNSIQEAIEPTRTGFETIMHVFAKFLDFFCEHREKILNFLHYFYLMNLFTKRRLSSENSENNSAVKNLEKSATKGFFTDKLSTIKGTLMSSKEKFKKIFSKLKDKIKNHLENWEKKIASVQRGQTFLRLIKSSWSTLKKLGENLYEIFLHLFSGGNFLQCLDAIKFSFPSLKSIVTGVISKVTTLETAIGLHAPGIVIWAVDMVIALICQFREFEKVLNYIKDAKNSNKKNVKFYYSGKIIGKLLNVFSTTPTFFSTIIGIISPFLM